MRRFVGCRLNVVTLIICVRCTQQNIAQKKIVVEEALFKQMNFKLRCKAEPNTGPNGNGEMRVKCIAHEMTPINFVNESKQLLESIRTMLR